MDLARLQEAEAHRRLKLLGTTIEEAKGTFLHVRARQVGVSVIVLRQWHSRYLHGGFSALVPTEWRELPDTVWSLINQRYSTLGDLAEAETIPPEDIHRLALAQGWTVRQARCWLRVYELVVGS